MAEELGRVKGHREQSLLPPTRFLKRVFKPQFLISFKKGNRFLWRKTSRRSAWYSLFFFDNLFFLSLSFNFFFFFVQFYLNSVEHGVDGPVADDLEDKLQILGEFYGILERGTIEEARRMIVEQGINIIDDDNAALSKAASAYRWDMVDMLLESGADLCSRDNNALRCAALEGNEEVMQRLIDRGATFRPYWQGVSDDIKRHF